MSDGTRMLSPTLVELLACPACRGDIEAKESEVLCVECARRYPLVDGVPMLAADLSHDEGNASLVRRLQYAILGNARVFDFQQKHFGGRPVADQLASRFRDLAGSTVLDIGAGTGMVAGLLPPATRYIWLDNDVRKLQGLLAKRADCDAVLGDAAALPFGSQAIEWSLMVEVSHHVPDEALHACFTEASRVTRERFLFVDAVRGPRRRSRIMWHLDLGRFPRTEEDLLTRLEQTYALESVERFRGVNHDHVLCVCVPPNVQVTRNEVRGENDAVVSEVE